MDSNISVKSHKDLNKCRLLKYEFLQPANVLLKLAFYCSTQLFMCAEISPRGATKDKEMCPLIYDQNFFADGERFRKTKNYSTARASDLTYWNKEETLLLNVCVKYYFIEAPRLHYSNSEKPRDLLKLPRQAISDDELSEGLKWFLGHFINTWN